MRLGFAIAAHLDADVLLLDEVFAVGDEAFQRKCFGKIFEFKQRGGTIVFVSHDAPQVERLCERAVLLREGRVEFDGPTHEAIVRYRRVLAAEGDPGRARGRAARVGERRGDDRRRRGCSAPEGEERRQFLAGEPLSLRLRIDAENGVAAAAAPARAARRGGPARRVGRRSTRPRSAGRRPASRALRFDVERLPLADGRFHLRLGLADADGRAAAALARRRARLPRLPGRRGARRRPAGRELGGGGERRDVDELAHLPDWPELMELAPDLQFMHYTVAEAQLPAEALTTITHVSLGDVAICCDLEHHVFYAAHTEPRGRRGAARDALVRGARVRRRAAPGA